MVRNIGGWASALAMFGTEQMKDRCVRMVVRLIGNARAGGRHLERKRLGDFRLAGSGGTLLHKLGLFLRRQPRRRVDHLAARVISGASGVSASQSRTRAAAAIFVQAGAE